MVTWALTCTNVSAQGDTTLQHQHLQLNYKELRNSCNLLRAQFNLYAQNDRKKFATEGGNTLRKVQAMLDEAVPVPLTRVEASNLRTLNAEAALGGSEPPAPSIKKAKELIDSVNLTLVKIEHYNMTKSDDAAYDSLVKQFQETVVLFQKLINFK